jgi:hypothetical protein
VWPGEVLEDRAGDIAVGFAALLTRQAAWRHRRVETITVLSHELVRRSVSVDFTVPAEHREDIRLSAGEWIVPLALLAKRPLAHFDLRMEDQSSVPLLRSEDTQLVGRELLYLMLDLDLEEGADARADGLIERVLATNGDDLGCDRRGPGRAGGAGRAGAGVRRAGERLARGFLLCAVIGDVSRRRVLKFAYDEPLDRPDRVVHFYDAPGCTEAAVVSRRGRRAGRDARADDGARRQRLGRGAGVGCRATRTGRRSTTSRTPGGGSSRA